MAYNTSYKLKNISAMDYKQHKGNLRGQIKNQVERKLYNKRIRAEAIDVDTSDGQLTIPDVSTRFILDIRCGCAAVRDTKHPEYDKDYQGLHLDTCDVVEYRHGFRNSEKGCWEMREEDIKFLTDYCASLNGVMPSFPDGLDDDSNSDHNFKLGWIACWKALTGNGV
jgi:hypothetical protein